MRSGEENKFNMVQFIYRWLIVNILLCALILISGAFGLISQAIQGQENEFYILFIVMPVMIYILFRNIHSAANNFSNLYNLPQSLFRNLFLLIILAGSLTIDWLIVVEIIMRSDQPG